MMHDLASELLKHRLDEKMIDVPLSLQHGQKKYPLGRYLRRKLRTFIGREANAPHAILEAQKQELQAMRETAFETSTPLSEEIQKKLKGKHANLYAKQRIWGQKRNTI